MALRCRLIVLFTLTICLLATAAVSVAQDKAPASDPAAVPSSGPNPSADLSLSDPAPSSAGLPANPVPQSAPWTVPGDGWRGAVAINGWFPGSHGTVGVLGHDAGYSAPFSDVFHFLKGVIPVTVEADKGRFVMPIDYLWLKLADGKATPFTDLTSRYVNIHLTESILTPLAGYRVIDSDRFKVDALGGIRYWYVGQNLALIGTSLPSNPTFAKSANWVDGLGGARFILPLSEKAAVTVYGDAGAGAANLDYEVAGLLTYNFKPKIGVSVGWRYLDVDYRPTNKQFVFDTALSGAMLGFYFNFGGKPPVPPTASCSASPAQVLEGEPVTVTATGSNFNPKHPLTYAWTGNGGKLSSTNTQTATIDTTGMAGDFAKGIIGNSTSYTASATITDAKEKKNNTASCTATYTVNPRPVHPPVVSCSASPSAIAINQSATVTLTASSPDNRPLTYSWTNSGGTQFSGSGTSATVVATNADAGNTITVKATATDDRNLSTSCTASITVPQVEKVKEVEDWGECTFEKDPKRPWRVDNDCKDVLDKLALRVQQMPNGKVAVVGYSDQTEVVNAETIGSQRAVNVKYYMTTDELGPKVDPTHLEPRKGGAKGKAVHFYYVPQGQTFTQEESVTVDESAVQGQSRSAPAPKKAKAKKTAATTPNQ